jgi:hypothetical protein
MMAAVVRREKIPCNPMSSGADPSASRVLNDPCGAPAADPSAPGLGIRVGRQLRTPPHRGWGYEWGASCGPLRTGAGLRVEKSFT